MNCWWLSVDMIENGDSEWYILNCLDGSMVEHLSSKQKVAGSSPVLSNILPLEVFFFNTVHFCWYAQSTHAWMVYSRVDLYMIYIIPTALYTYL